MLIASCSLKGLPCATRNDARTKLLSEIMHDLRRRDFPCLDAIVLPGGFLVQENPPSLYLNLNFRQRREQLHDWLEPSFRVVAQEFKFLTKDTKLIFGVDTVSAKNPAGDQLCVAWAAGGVEGIGRKVFPTKGEAEGGYVVNVDDFGARQRVITLGDSRILLCACYDGFGISGSDRKAKLIQKMSLKGRLLHLAGPNFREALADGLKKWRNLVDGVDAAAIAIHYFENKRGNLGTSRWRCHGIATASAKLSGWVVAGANFDVRLPNPERDILAADDVPKEHLDISSNRKAHDSQVVSEYVVKSCEGVAQIRVFEFARAPRFQA